MTANQLGYALFSPVYADPIRPANNARFVFLDPHAPEFFRDWDKVANDTVALLRAEAGRNAYDRRLSDLIGELSTRSNDFRRRWAAHDVQIHSTGIKLIHHPIVGDLDLPYESFPLTARPQPEPAHLHRRTGIAHPGRPHPAGQLGLQRGRRSDPQDRARELPTRYRQRSRRRLKAAHSGITSARTRAQVSRHPLQAGAGVQRVPADLRRPGATSSIVL